MNFLQIQELDISRNGISNNLSGLKSLSNLTVSTRMKGIDIVTEFHTSSAALIHLTGATYLYLNFFVIH